MPGMTNGNGAPAATVVANSTKLRQLLQGPDIVQCPGVYDGISARCALTINPAVLYVSGAGVTAARLGLPDLAFASQDDFVAQAGMIAQIAGTTPVIADADTGFGSPNQVARTVQRYAQAGIAGCHIEDQVVMKRCGHLLGKQVIPKEEYGARIHAAALGRSRVPGSDFVIIARTDALQSNGIDDAIERLKIAVANGADVAFLEGATTKEEVHKAVAALAPTPVLLNLVAFGVTPPWTAKESQEMGAKICIFPAAGFKVAMVSLLQAYQTLKKTGTDAGLAPGVGPREFFEVMGLKDAMELDAAVGSTMYAGGL